MAVNIIGLWEGQRLFQKRGFFSSLWICIPFSLLIFIAVWLKLPKLELIFWLILVVLSLVYATFVKDKDDRIGIWVGNVILTLYVTFLLSFLVRLYRMEHPELSLSGRGLVMLLFITIWAMDTSAYFIGRTFGRHRFFPHISPRKTWEGFFGGVLGAVIIGVVILLMGVDRSMLLPFFCITIIISVTGQIGDLAESMLKRQAGIKDSSLILPGHGGVLDRIDSLLFAGPAVFIYISLLDISSLW